MYPNVGKYSIHGSRETQKFPQNMGLPNNSLDGCSIACDWCTSPRRRPGSWWSFRLNHRKTIGLNPWEMEGLAMFTHDYMVFHGILEWLNGIWWTCMMVLWDLPSGFISHMAENPRTFHGGWKIARTITYFYGQFYSQPCLITGG